MADELVDVVFAVASVHAGIRIALVHVAQTARIVVSKEVKRLAIAARKQIVQSRLDLVTYPFGQVHLKPFGRS